MHLIVKKGQQQWTISECINIFCYIVFVFIFSFFNFVTKQIQGSVKFVKFKLSYSNIKATFHLYILRKNLLSCAKGEGLFCRLFALLVNVVYILSRGSRQRISRKQDCSYACFWKRKIQREKKEEILVNLYTPKFSLKLRFISNMSPLG